MIDKWRGWIIRPSNTHLPALLQLIHFRLLLAYHLPCDAKSRATIKLAIGFARCGKMQCALVVGEGLRVCCTQHPSLRHAAVEGGCAHSPDDVSRPFKQTLFYHCTCIAIHLFQGQRIGDGISSSTMNDVCRVATPQMQIQHFHPEHNTVTETAPTLLLGGYKFYYIMAIWRDCNCISFRFLVNDHIVRFDVGIFLGDEG